MAKKVSKWQTIWILETRNKNVAEDWSATGRTWFFGRNQAVRERNEARRENDWLEYRVTKYLPESR